MDVNDGGVRPGTFLQISIEFHRDATRLCELNVDPFLEHLERLAKSGRNDTKSKNQRQQVMNTHV
jgi:hypothetical protein